MALFRLIPTMARTKAAFPAIAFFGGFLWDAVTLGQSIKSLDLFILLGYMATAGGILVWMGRRGSMRGRSSAEAVDGPGRSVPTPGAGTQEAASAAAHASTPGPKPRLSRRAKILAWMREDGLAFSLQFLFGSLFSALVIFYFLSSSYLPGFLLVISLVALLILNEFLESQYHRFTITWTLYGICAILFLNFALPHLVHSIHPVWFFISTAAGVASVYGIKALSPNARGSTWPILGAAALLVLLYVVNAIPPVPLVKKSMIICRNLVKTDGRYEGKMEKPPLWSAWRKSEAVVRQRPGEKVFCFTSVFLPTGINTTLFHRWSYDDPLTGKWVQYSRIGFPISGGRQDGFRGYTYKRNLAPGRWEVRVETASGRVLGNIHFDAEASADSTMEFRKLALE